jgi:hypothetical protein
VHAGSSVVVDDFEQLPDILLLVLDGYARDDTLASLYDFDNDAILGELRSRGFEVGYEATANYSITH